MTLVGLRAVEVTASGTIDFVSRIKRGSFPRTALLRVEGQTTRSGSWSPGGSYRSSVAHQAKFIFADAGQKETEKTVSAPRKDDPALQEFVRQLEGYFNLKGEKTLRGYTRPLNLSAYDRVGWMWRDERLDDIGVKLGEIKSYKLLTPAQIRVLQPVDKRSFEAGMYGTRADELYNPM